MSSQKKSSVWAESETLARWFPDKIEAQLANMNAPTKSILERMRKQFKREKIEEKKEMKQLKTVLFYYLETSIASLKLKYGHKIVCKAIDFRLSVVVCILST